MEIASIRHKALRKFYETGDARGLNAALLVRLSRMFLFLRMVQSLEELMTPPNYGAHRLHGNLFPRWSMSVTRNWRMTFLISDELIVSDVDLEDYHGA